MAAAVESMGGLSVTPLRSSTQQGDFFESAGLVPLPSVAGRKQLDTLKSSLVIFTFHIVGLEDPSPDLPIDLVKAGMFFNATAPRTADLFTGFF